jgi:hypothetical protein
MISASHLDVLITAASAAEQTVTKDVSPLVPALEECVKPMNELPQLEPISLPHVANLDVIPSLPAWVDALIATVSHRPDRSTAGHYRNGPWMPAEAMPTAAQRCLIARHVDALKKLMVQTPERDKASGMATLALITKLMQAMPGYRMSEAAIKARVEAFMVALESDPYWAVAEAIRGWYRGKYGEQHDYRKQPAPAVLHKLAMREAWKIGIRARQLEDILNAETPLTFSDEHRERMLKRLATEIPALLGTRQATRSEAAESA